MRAASLCIGVVAYAHPAYGASSARLKYASSDARAFSAYASAASPGADSDQRHILLVDGDAEFSEVREAIEEIGKLDDLELFILYLAGHGERGSSASGGWFCLADASPDQPSLDAPKLDELLGGVRADKILVIVDCCHAAALTDAMRTFASLGERRALLYIASARAEQLAWEDDKLQRSVFSDVFLRACSTSSPLQNTAGQIPVEASLYPYLREQVPLLAAAQKQGAVQEPVTGCIAHVDVQLPTVSSTSFGRSLTIAQTVRQRLRQVVVKTTVAIVLVVAITEMLTYHVAVDYAGRVMVRPGFRATHALVPAILARNLDTGFRTSDLSAASRIELSGIADGQVWGFATHKDRDGVRPWLSVLAPLLDPDVRARIDMLVRGDARVELAADSPPPIEQYLFQVQQRQRRDAAPRKDLEELGLSMYQHTEVPLGGCQANANVLDYSLINVPAAPFVRDLWWQSATVGYNSLDVQINVSGYRASTAKDSDAAVFDLRALTLSMAYLAASKRTNILEADRFRHLLATPCRSHVAVAQRLLGQPGLALAAEAAMVADVLSFDRNKQGDLPSVKQALAAEALVLMSAAAALSAETLDAMASAQLSQDRDLDRNTLQLVVLRAAAQRGALPPYFVTHLFGKLEGLESFGQLAALDLLSRNIAQLQPSEQQRLSNWLDANAERKSMMSDVHSAIGRVLQGTRASKPAQIDLLVARLSPGTLLPVPMSGYRGEMAISANGDEAAVALGRALQAIQLPTDVIDRLIAFAIARPDAADRQEILDGLAKNWYPDGPKAETLYQRLGRAGGDARRRALEVEVACSCLVLVDLSMRSATVDALLEQWAHESEPELRAALARVVARSAWPRYASMTMCSGA